MTLSMDSRWQPCVKALLHSHYLERLLSCRPRLAETLLTTWSRAPTRADMQIELDTAAIGEDEARLYSALRQLRQRVFAHLILRDLCAEASLAEVMETMTQLAEITVNRALQFLHHDLVQRFGEPRGTTGDLQRLIVIGMGKLGGRELNVSSDVDLIFVYPEDGETAGPKVIDNFDFFSRLGKRLIAVLDEITEDGQVFRVDMRLRPYGDSGPLVSSLAALENYFFTQGREWERYAWIKARVLNDSSNASLAAQARFDKIVTPFVFRKYLDYGAINAMRDLYAQIRREVMRKDMVDHVKMGPGGIREIEFIAQVFQLIRGGRDSTLRVRPTLAILHLLRDHRLLPAATVDELLCAYGFLRRVEHRLQYVNDQQTHRLPKQEEERRQLAVSMGFADWSAFSQALDGHRAKVEYHFDEVFSDPVEGEHPLEAIWFGQMDHDDLCEKLSQLGFHQPSSVMEILARFRSSYRYQQLPASNREHLDAVGSRLLEVAGQGKSPDAILRRGLQLLEAISRRSAYLVFLQQYPQALTKVADLIGDSSWAADYLTRHPILLDELLDPRLLDVATDWQGFRHSLARALQETENDPEQEMNVLREMHHAQVFRLLVQDLSGLLPLETLSDHLTELADIMLGEIMRLCWSKLKYRHREQPAMAIIGYGKLGGKELGYASDLDLVFLYANDDNPDAADVYSRLVQRINTWCSSQTASGNLFEIDLRLRPDGESGVLACPIEAFGRYQNEQAWIWEHQALTRARFCVGDEATGTRFEAMRNEILMRERDLSMLKTEVIEMRQKMLDTHGHRAGSLFNIKHDPGGLVDVEFIVQYLVLGYSHRFPVLTGNKGNIALLKMAAECGLIAMEQAETVRNAYREYRRLQHQMRLNGIPDPYVDPDQIEESIAAVRSLWNAVL